jgi:hypothetical protein
MVSRQTLLAAALVVLPACNAKRIEQLEIGQQELEDTNKRQQEQILALTSAKAVTEAAEKKLGWSTNAVPGVTGLEAAGLVLPEADKCKVVVAVTYSNRALLPTAAVMEVSKKGGEVIATPTVDVSRGKMELTVNAACSTLGAVALHR